MKITVTGSTGFIGNYVVQELLSKQIEILATGTSSKKVSKYNWAKDVTFLELDLIKPPNEGILKQIASSDAVIHLAWAGLPNYKDLFHFEENLMPQYFFLKRLIELGLKDLTVTGTCFEYGMKSGSLHVAMPADPQNPYALAKDTLRKFLQQLQTKHDFKLKWIRLFYMYGKGQSEKSILSQLDRALANKETVFNMSAGEQLRDYLPVEQVAKNIVALALDPSFDGIANCCSGKPISIRTLVENYLKTNNQTISLNLGHYAYSDIEPMAFWGV